MIDLTLFCDATRPPIAQPFTMGGCSYATDGKILIEVARRADVPEFPITIDGVKVKPPQVHSVLADYFPEGDWQPMPKLPELIPSTCCNFCDGIGEIEEATPIQIGQRTLNAWLLKRIADLPGLLVNTTGAAMSPMSFKFDEGRGLIMPMRV